MRQSQLIKHFDYHETTVSLELLKDALDLYEEALQMMVDNPPKDINSHIPGSEEFNVCHGIIETYYKQNPGFDYNFHLKDFTPAQAHTLSNIQGDWAAMKRMKMHKNLKRYY